MRTVRALLKTIHSRIKNLCIQIIFIMNKKVYRNKSDLWHAEPLSGSVGMDIDIQRVGNETDAEYQTRLSKLEKELLSQAETMHILLLERSASKGYHVVLKRDPKLTQIQNLQLYSQLLSVPFDEGAKDHTRVFFASTASAEDLLYLSPELFDNETEYESSNVPSSKEPSEPSTGTSQTPQTSQTFPNDYDGIPYPLLVECLADQLGGVPVHGSRNNFLFSMACHLRYVCNDDPKWICQVLPTYGEDRERVYRTVQSACNRAQSRNIPALVQRAISIARGQVNALNIGTGEPSNPISASEPPALPKKLPKLIQLLVSNVAPAKLTISSIVFRNCAPDCRFLLSEYEFSRAQVYISIYLSRVERRESEKDK